MTPVGAAWSLGEEASLSSLAATYSCDQCNKFSGALSARRSDDGGRSAAEDAKRRADSDWRWFPQGTESRVYPDVPETIGAVASEAHLCASIGAYVGAILLARTVVEATAKDKEITKGNLVAKIDALKDANLIRPGIAEAAHEIRHFGNDMAHGDLDDSPDPDDANDVLALMAQVLSEVYQGPALVAKVRARRSVPPQ